MDVKQDTLSPQLFSVFNIYPRVMRVIYSYFWLFDKCQYFPKFKCQMLENLNFSSVGPLVGFPPAHQTKSGDLKMKEALQVLDHLSEKD